MSMLTSNHVPPVVNAEESTTNRELLHPQRGARERELLQVLLNYYFVAFRCCNDANHFNLHI